MYYNSKKQLNLQFLLGFQDLYSPFSLDPENLCIPQALYPILPYTLNPGRVGPWDILYFPFLGVRGVHVAMFSQGFEGHASYILQC